MTNRERYILQQLARGGWLRKSSGHTTTYRLLMPSDAWYAGEVIRAATIARMRENGLLDSDLRAVRKPSTH